jgi:hypothetical protein
MTNLYIQNKQQKGLLNLKVVTEKEKFPALVEKKDGKLTLISEEKTYYLYLNKQSAEYDFHKIYNFFAAFAKENQKLINIEVKSFTTPNLNEELVLQAISEGVLFGIHKAVEWKQKTISKKHICSEKNCYKVQEEVISCELVHQEKSEKPEGSYEIKIKSSEEAKKVFRNKDNIFYYGLKKYGKREEPEAGKVYDFYTHGKSKGGYLLLHD